ncbi:alpha-N-acetylgalactosaminide alpha-2,6-sialyltransferase 2-like [Patiria miniata]|uniref:alpha-N-acetylgalactosaminide alpha-2,6-sialyltransferase n=1 Tax=Patiria miniata TaxID=46514 RepID=A0A914B7Q2_PATMI|nr:alpha-N-acetylgalactosaminide alpha-2,6-sialyltransferase 2-like [Patiria miniata]
MVNFDAVSLFTNVPTSDACKFGKERFQLDSILKDRNDLTPDRLHYLLLTYVTSSGFCWRDKFFERMNVQQYQRVVDRKTTAIKPVQAKVSSENDGSDIVTVTTEKPTPVIQKAEALTKANEPTKCPTSVRHKMLTTPFTRNKFVLHTPILAWDEHYSHEEYVRLAQFHGIFGWKSYNEIDISSSLTKLDSPHNRYLFDNRLVNGKIPDDDKCITCAVIGNGGILKGSKKGKEIDANDYVFRVNTALTKGYEEDVGSRTSFYCFGMSTLSNTLAGGFETKFRQLPNDEGIRYVFFADGYWAYTYLASVLHGGKGTVMTNRYPVRFPKKLQATDIKLVHPDFERYLKWSWVNSTNQHSRIHRPTTGGIMLLLALHTCDEVNAYGFGGSYTKFSEHYYDKSFHKHVDYLNHDTTAENRLWKKLHNLGIINMYTRG